MPRNKDLKSILIIGSGPIIIGQACEFDYSGSQASRSLREEGVEISLINSNPATIMTDNVVADHVYLKPLTTDSLIEILEERDIDAVLPTMGGQTALNLCIEADEKGIWKKYSVDIIGVDIEAIHITEDRERFRKLMKEINIPVAPARIATSFLEGKEIAQELGFPLVIRPSFTLGGTGASFVHTKEQFEDLLSKGLHASPIHEVLIDKAVLGWKEYELELLRDDNDNVIIICSIENFDPMGIHTGDSITVAPCMTLSDTCYQKMRKMAIKMMRSIGDFAGGCNVQFAVSPDEKEDIIAIEINPRVSRSSALASKATGYPIAKIAAKLAIGYTLDELDNQITKSTSSFFEPALDYVVVKIPRFTFEKFPQTKPELGTQMKSVGEVMSIGSTFKEALGKAMRSLEIDNSGFDLYEDDKDKIIKILKSNNPKKLWYLANALRAGMSIDDIYKLTKIDKWFLNNIKEIIDLEFLIKKKCKKSLDEEVMQTAKKNGFSDSVISDLLNKKEEEIRDFRIANGIVPSYKMVDTCAAEFEAHTPYLYSTYQSEDESKPTNKKKIAILGGGPNRIGQGIEFDYCCVHASFALKDDGYQTLMINCNPETVSTDYDISDKLYFEPLTAEDTISIINKEKPDGTIVHLGGQTPLKLALDLEKAGANIIGTSADSIDLAEDRERFKNLMQELGILQPESGIANSSDEALKLSTIIGYPIIVRPSYVLGGRAMEVAYSENDLIKYLNEAVSVSNKRPVLIDKFLNDAKEVDVDAISDGENVVICGILEHIENQTTMGHTPRNFSITPDESMILVANQDSGDIFSFHRDRTSGLLEFTGNKLDIPAPVCIQFMGKNN